VGVFVIVTGDDDGDVTTRTHTHTHTQQTSDLRRKLNASLTIFNERKIIKLPSTLAERSVHE
jgi:hypothetical protein